MSDDEPRAMGRVEIAEEYGEPRSPEPFPPAIEPEVARYADLAGWRRTRVFSTDLRLDFVHTDGSDHTTVTLPVWYVVQVRGIEELELEIADLAPGAWPWADSILQEGEGRIVPVTGGTGFVLGGTAVVRLEHALVRATLDGGPEARPDALEARLGALLDLSR
jgi:hypothetical protein